MNTKPFTDVQEKLQHYLSEHSKHLRKIDTRCSQRWLLIAAISFLALAFVLYMRLGYHGGFQTINASSPWLPAAAWQTLTFFGDSAMMLTLLAFFLRRQPAILAVSMTSAAIGTIVVQSLKHGFMMARPSAVLAQGDFVQIGIELFSRAFPSGHSLTVFIFVSTLLLFSSHNVTRLQLLLMGCVLATSRVMVGAHWPIDVLVGGAIGMLCTLAGFHLTRRFALGLSVRGFLFLSGIVASAALTLLFYDGGYPDADPIARLVGTVALVIMMAPLIIRISLFNPKLEQA